MTRYELFEAWLTPKEWATWKKHSVTRFMRINGTSRDTAKERRKMYLNEQVNIDVNDTCKLSDEWDDMTNKYIRWDDTPQGHSYWERVNRRFQPVRTLPPMRTVLNNVN